MSVDWYRVAGILLLAASAVVTFAIGWLGLVFVITRLG